MNRSIVNIGKKLVPHNIRIALRKLNWNLRFTLQKISSGSSNPPVECPIAEKEFPFFLKLGKDTITPTNGARARQRLVWLYLKKELDILNTQRDILHIAPEISYYKLLNESKSVNYFPGDKMVDGYSNQQGIDNIDLTGLKYEDNKFDAIICNHVLEHIPDDTKAMSEMLRVLKPGGKAIVTVPIKESLSSTFEDESIVTPEDREKNFGQWDHVRWYAPDIKDRFNAVGFSTELNKYAHKYSKEDQAKYGLCEDLIVIATKPSA